MMIMISFLQRFMGWTKNIQKSNETWPYKIKIVTLCRQLLILLNCCCLLCKGLHLQMKTLKFLSIHAFNHKWKMAKLFLASH